MDVRVEKISERLLLVDLEPLNASGWIATYVIVGRRSLAIVDPGPRASLANLRGLVDGLRIDGYDSVYVLLTHVHIDHSGASGDLVEMFPRSRVLVHPRGVKHLAEPSRLWSSSLEVLGELAKALGEPKPIPQDLIISVENGAQLDLGDAVLTTFHTPGHAPHHVVYVLEPDGVLLAGDSIANYFSGRIYPVTVHPFNGDEYLRSLDLMLSLKPKSIAVAHYGLVREDPEVFIQRARDKLAAWIYCVESAAKEGVEDPRAIHELVLGRDVELAYARSLESRLTALWGSTYRVVYGLYRYVVDRRAETLGKGLASVR